MTKKDSLIGTTSIERAEKYLNEFSEIEGLNEEALILGVKTLTRVMDVIAEGLVKEVGGYADPLHLVLDSTLILEEAIQCAREAEELEAAGKLN